MTVYILDSRLLGDADLDRYYHYLPKERQYKMDKAFSIEQKKLQMAAGIIIGYALWEFETGQIGQKNISEIFVLKNAEMEEFLKKAEQRLHYSMDYGLQGKPYLPAEEDFHFNLSHSGTYVICAVDVVPIGVDIQKIDAKKGKQIAKRFFSKAEQDILEKAKEAEQETLFCRFWAAKESYLKYLGTGLKDGLSNHVVDLEQKKVLDCNGKELAALTELDGPEGYVLFVCRKRELNADKMR